MDGYDDYDDDVDDEESAQLRIQMDIKWTA